MESSLRHITKQLLLLTPILSLTLNATQLGMTAGIHDMMVSNIDNLEFNGADSHTFGIDAGIFAYHKTESGIILKADATFFLDRDRDHLDPDHIPFWWMIDAYVNGPMFHMGENWSARWLLDVSNKQNTVSGIERQQKQAYGVGFDYTSHSSHLAFNGYGGFFYRELDDDAPQVYGYDRRDLGYGASIYSFLLEGSHTFGGVFTIGAHAQTWHSLGIGATWLEHELKGSMRYNTDFLIEQSAIHLDVEYTKYNLDVYYRPDLGVPALPWDNDTLIRTYMSIPWTL